MASPGSGTAAVPAAPRTLPDRLLGVVGGLMLVLGLALLVRGGEDDAGVRPVVEAPRIQVLEPKAGTGIEGPLRLVFRADADLRRQPMGWGTGELHLHLQVDGQQFMPSPTDIEPLPSGAYRWTFGRLEPGTHQLRLFWSDAAHAPIAAGGSPLFEVHAR